MGREGWGEGSPTRRMYWQLWRINDIGFHSTCSDVRLPRQSDILGPQHSALKRATV